MKDTPKTTQKAAKKTAKETKGKASDDNALIQDIFKSAKLQKKIEKQSVDPAEVKQKKMEEKLKKQWRIEEKLRKSCGG